MYYQRRYGIPLCIVALAMYTGHGKMLVGKVVVAILQANF